MLSQSVSHVAVKKDYFTDRLGLYSAIFGYSSELIKNSSVKIPNSLSNFVNFVVRKKELGLQILASFIATLKSIGNNAYFNNELVYKLDSFLESGLNTGLRFGKEFKELYILPFSNDLQLHIAYQVFIREVQRLFSVRLTFRLYHKREVDSFNEINGTTSNLSYFIPEKIPHKLVYQDFRSFDDLIAVKVVEENIATGNERVFIYHIDEIIMSGAKEFFKKKFEGKKNCWATHKTEMLRKTVVVQYIKTHFRDRALDNRLKTVIDIDDQLNMVN